MHTAKYSKYQEYNQNPVLFKGIADLYPYPCKLPDAPKYEKFTNFGLNIENQYFKREQMPLELRRIDTLVKSGSITREEGIAAIERDKELTKYVEGLWRKRTGEDLVFQYVNGVPTFIPHTYWFYLNFWHLDIGLPDFRTDKYHNAGDLEEFQVWDCIVVPHDYCYGMTELSGRRGGKCFARGTKIRMYDGSVKKVENIREGELVMGNDSTPRKVHGITTGREKMYRVIPTKGDEFICNESHILALKKRWKKECSLNISIRDYLKLSEYDKSKMCLYRAGWGKHFKKNYHFIDPYILGVFLGDGCKHNGNITNVDKEILDSVKEFCSKNKLKMSPTDKITYQLVNDIPKGKWAYNPYRQELKRLNLFHNKHIPAEYLIDSEENRLNLLAGLLDTDGSLVIKKKVEYSYSYSIIQKNKKLAENIVELARSLGFYVSIRDKRATMRRRDDSLYECLVSRISIYGNIDKIPCRVSRKKISRPYNPKINSMQTSFRIEPIGDGDYYGFAVNDNNLFLLEDGTVVHNTYKGGCIVYEPISRNYEWHGYVQSKTDLDAERAFIKSIVKPWRMLPFFFQPIYSNSSFPKKEGLQFNPRSKKSLDGAAQLYDDDTLMSDIVYVSAEVMAIDGQKAHRILEDESGKTKDIDSYERWNVNKFTLIENGRIVGKAFHPTTVEEMEKKGGKYYKAKFDDSDRDPNKRTSEEIKIDSNGETVSGLYPLFIPAYCNEMFNQHGTAIVDKITNKEMEYLKRMKYKYWNMTGIEAVDKQINDQKDPYKKQEIIRKKPRTIKEAFRSATTFCHFNIDILNKRLDHFIKGYTFEELPKPNPDASVTDNVFTEEELQGPGLRWGMFEPVDVTKPFGDMKFTPTDKLNARCHVNYLLPPGMRNRKLLVEEKKYRPGNTAIFRSGADPFKYDTKDVKNPSHMSKGAQHIYMDWDERLDGYKPREKWVSRNFIYEYFYRNPNMTKDELFYDWACACIYYGCSIYPERNNSEVLDYFKRNGLEHYIQYGLRVATAPGQGLGYKQDTVGGDITTEYTIQKMFRHLANFVKHDACACVFYRTLEQLRDVEDKEDLNKNDLFVSAAYTLMAFYEADLTNIEDDAPAAFNGEDLKELNGYDMLHSTLVPTHMSERYYSN